MAHTPGPWFVGYSPEYDIDTGDDGQTIGHLTGKDEFDGTVFMVTGEDQVEIIAEHIRDEKTAHQIKAIPDMLEAMEEVVAITENLPVCPFCGAVKGVQSHRPDCLSHEINAAIRKARGAV